MKLQIYKVDAFTDSVFKGNPAAVVPLDRWLSTETLQSIAMENNLSETAFFVLNQHHYELRWFTPLREVEVCGHATLASAFVIIELLQARQNQVAFQTMRGPLWVTKNDALYTLDFPAIKAESCEVQECFTQSFGISPMEAYAADDYMLVFADAKAIHELAPNMTKLKTLDRRGVIATAPGEKDVDFVSRFFAPNYGVEEDPVTGSAHCMLVPYWAAKLNKQKMLAMQLSSRTGRLACEFDGKRVIMSGQAVLYLQGEIFIPD